MIFIGTPAFWALGTAAVGALAGLCVPRAAYRLSVPEAAPARSACASCAVPLPPGRAGWVRPGGRCPACRAALGPPWWLTSAAGALTCGVIGWALNPAAADGLRCTAAALLALTAFLVTGVAGVLLGAVDLASRRLPNVIVGPVIAVVLPLLGASAAVRGTGEAAQDLLRAAAGALALSGGYLALALLPRAPLGMGDVKLCALLGLVLGWLGWRTVLMGTLLPHLINGPVVLGLLLTGRVRRGTELPLGPALLAGALLALALSPAAR